MAVARIPTPTAGGAKSSGSRKVSLTDYVQTGDSHTPRTLTNPPTTARDAANDGGPSQFRRNSLPLNAVAKLWPTPKSSPSGPDFARAGREESGGDDLATAVARSLWPTPQAADGHGGRNEMAAFQRAQEAGEEQPKTLTRPSGAKAVLTLRTAVNGQERSSGQLNPMWVEWLMGFPLGWTDLGVSETRSSRRSPSGSAGGL